MNIFVAGGGRVGLHLARLLSVEKHDVTIIDSDATRAEHLDFILDGRAVHGDMVSVMLLREIGVGSADLFVAVTGNDEINLISAATAKGLGAKQVVARVHEAVFIESNILYETILGIDYVLSPEALTALEIAKFVESPGVVAAENFGRGLVQMRHVRVATTPTNNGKTLKDVFPPGSGVLLGMVSRGGKTFIPHGDSVIEKGDVVTLVGHREKMADIQKLFHGIDERPHNIVIMGGGSIGLHLAHLLENQQISVKLFDNNSGKCTDLASRLHRVAVVCRDATSRTELEQERVDRVDLFIATTSDDERNIMACVLASEVGAQKTLAVIHQPDFASLVNRLGIDHAVTPRAVITNRILRLVHQKQVSTLAVLEEGKVEILELPITHKTSVVGRPLRQMANKIPRNALVATILRGEDVLVPSGDDTIEIGDAVVVIAELDSVDAVRKLFLK